MKLYFITFLFVTSISFCFSQELDKKEAFLAYEQFLQKRKKDTLIYYRSKEYKCSDNFFGTVYYYYQGDDLKLIEHVYKQGFYEDYIFESYYIEERDLVLQSVRTKITHQNTVSYKNKYEVGFSVENVYELIERRALIGIDNNVLECYSRGEGKEISVSEKLDFETDDCYESLDEINTKFKFLLKAEKKFLRLHHKGPACIFHMW